MFNVSDSDSEKLFDAAKKNDLEALKFLIEERNAAPITVLNPLRQSLAHVAARNGNLEVVKYVVEKQPAILSKTDKHNYTVLRLAVKAGAMDVVRYLAEKQETHLSESDLKGEAMHTAVKYDRLDILKYFVEERKFSVDALGEWENRPLIFSAVAYRHEDIVDYLEREKQVDFTVLDSRQENILYVTVRTDNLPYMKYVLEQKGVMFDINWRNLYGETLVYRAVSLNRTNILEYLVDERHADVNIASKDDELTPLHCAAIQNNFDMCRYLVEHEANVTVADANKETAAQKAKVKPLKMYLKGAASPSAMRYRRGVTCMSGTYDCPSSDAVDSSYSSQLQNFFVLAGLVTNGVRYSFRQGRRALLSPWSILQNKMDPVAMEAVDSVYE